MRTRGTRLQAYLFVLPALAIFATFVLYPMLATLVLGLFSWKAMSPERHWAGLANYSELLGDAVFLTSLRNNGLWILASLAVQLPLALLLAVALNSQVARLRMLRTAFFTPFVLPVVAVALVWWLIYEPNFGLANALLRGAAQAMSGLLTALGLMSREAAKTVTVAWLGDERLATLSIIAVASWRFVGFHTVILLAGLQTSSDDYYDAARLDGATGWQTFRHVTLPLLRRIIAADALLIVVGSVKVFDLIWVMTGGGPYHATEVLATYMYYCGFTIDRMGYSAAIATIMVVITMAATALYLRLTQLAPEEA